MLHLLSSREGNEQVLMCCGRRFRAALQAEENFSLRRVGEKSFPDRKQHLQ